MEFLNTFLNSNFQLLVTLALLFAYFIIRYLVRRLVKNHAKTRNIAFNREVYIKKLISGTLLVIFITIVGMVWEISIQGLSLYFASIFTVVGVALFANWSILSNLTASVILFFFFPYRIGNTVKIIDGDNSIEGEIIDITLFYIKIKSDGKYYAYPNNLAIQKPISHI